MADGGSAFIEHVVSRTDTLAFLAVKYSASVADIKRANKLFSEQGMHARRTLRIPVTAATYANLGGREAERVSEEASQRAAAAGGAQAEGRRAAGHARVPSGEGFGVDEAALAAGDVPRSRVMRQLAGAGGGEGSGAPPAAAAAIARAQRAGGGGPSFVDEDLLVVERLAEQAERMGVGTDTVLRDSGVAGAPARETMERRRAAEQSITSGSGWDDFDSWGGAQAQQAPRQQGQAPSAALPPRAPLFPVGAKGGGSGGTGSGLRKFLGLGGRTPSSSSLSGASGDEGGGGVEMRRLSGSRGASGLPTSYGAGKKAD